MLVWHNRYSTEFKTGETWLHISTQSVFTRRPRGSHSLLGQPASQVVLKIKRGEGYDCHPQLKCKKTNYLCIIFYTIYNHNGS